MAKHAKERFCFATKEPLTAKSHNQDVVALQTLLTRFGYLRGTFEPGRLCPATQRSVRRYQRFYHLKPDGIVGPITKKSLEQPRCGVPDIPVSPGGETPGAPFVLRGCKYNKNDLSYAFINGTADLAGSREREIVRQAFEAWEGVANLRFQEVEANRNPDFRIAWRSGNHGDGDGFDGAGNILAHAFFPPPCGGPNAGDLHFDEAERWVDDPTANGILLLQVAIHEIGHLLGLSHSQDESAIMFAFYSPDRVNLADDDIKGAIALYGERSTIQQLQLGAAVNGSLPRAGEQTTFELKVPSAFSVILDGPADADFDLYVRKDEPPTPELWDFRAYTVAADERITFPAEAGASYFVMVRSYDGAGDYQLRVEPA